MPRIRAHSAAGAGTALGGSWPGPYGPDRGAGRPCRGHPRCSAGCTEVSKGLGDLGGFGRRWPRVPSRATPAGSRSPRRAGCSASRRPRSGAGRTPAWSGPSSPPAATAASRAPASRPSCPSSPTARPSLADLGETPGRMARGYRRAADEDTVPHPLGRRAGRGAARAVPRLRPRDRDLARRGPRHRRPGPPRGPAPRGRGRLRRVRPRRGPRGPRRAR